jgi:hypothetical protein
MASGVFAQIATDYPEHRQAGLVEPASRPRTSSPVSERDWRVETDEDRRDFPRVLAGAGSQDVRVRFERRGQAPDSVSLGTSSLKNVSDHRASSRAS